MINHMTNFMRNHMTNHMINHMTNHMINYMINYMINNVIYHMIFFSRAVSFLEDGIITLTEKLRKASKTAYETDSRIFPEDIPPKIEKTIHEILW